MKLAHAEGAKMGSPSGLVIAAAQKRSTMHQFTGETLTETRAVLTRRVTEPWFVAFSFSGLMSLRLSSLDSRFTQPRRIFGSMLHGRWCLLSMHRQ